jgi:hypothetical protein
MKWIPAEHAGTIKGNVICIYKFWSPEANQFCYEVKATRGFDDSMMVIGKVMRCVMVMPLDARNLAEHVLPDIIGNMIAEREERSNATLYDFGEGR